MTRTRPSHAPGFTLIELVATMLLIGILSAMAVPRFNMATFQAQGYLDELTAMVRYGHKYAMATGCPVEATFAANGYTLRVDCEDDGTWATMAALVASNDPDPDNPGSYNLTNPGPAPAGVTLGGATFRFDARGRSLNDSGTPLTTAVTVATFNGQTLQVEAETGYVRLVGP